ncbi:MAG: glycosyltransferase 87 family protein [Tetrasphaera sp.]
MRPDLFPPTDSELIGGPLGRHANPVGRWRRIVAQLTALVWIPMIVAVLQREYCVRNGWYGADQFWRECFSDLPAQYALGHLDTGLPGWLNGSAVLDQPVVAGAVMSAVGGLVPDGASALDQSRWYFLAWVVLITLLLAATVWCTAHLVPGDLQAAAQVALSPVIVLAAVLSADALVVALVAAAMLAWKRERHTVCGLVLGVATMTRSYAALVALALLLAAARSDVFAAAKRVAMTALASVLAIAMAAIAVRPQILTGAYRAWWESKASYGSPWLLPTLLACDVPACNAKDVSSAWLRWLSQLQKVELPVWSVTSLAVCGVVLAVIMGWIFTRESFRAPTWAQVAFVVVAMAMMTGKAVPVQASLWLLPLAAAAGVRWRDHLIWAGTEMTHFIAIWLYIGMQTRPDRALPGPWYALFLVIRLAGITWLVSRVWRAGQFPPALEQDRRESAEVAR